MIRNLIRLGTITNIYNQYGVVRAQVTVLSDDPEDVILLNPYGFNSCPQIGAMVEIHSIFGHPENTYGIPLDPRVTPQLQVGETIMYDIFGNKIYLKKDGDIDIVAAKNVNITAANTAASGTLSVEGFINTNTSYKVGDIKVVGNQQPAIPNPTGGATVDSEARTSINSILTALRLHGLINT